MRLGHMQCLTKDAICIFEQELQYLGTELYDSTTQRMLFSLELLSTMASAFLSDELKLISAWVPFVRDLLVFQRRGSCVRDIRLINI